MKKQDKTPKTLGGNFLNDFVLQYLSKFISLGVEAEVESYMAKHEKELTGKGQRRFFVAKPRETRFIETALGPVSVLIPFICDRNRGSGRHFLHASTLCPKRVMTKPYINHYLAWKYIEGLATADFKESKGLLLDPHRPYFPKGISLRFSRLLIMEHELFNTQRIDDSEYLALWLDSVDFNQGGLCRHHRLLLACGLTPKGEVVLLGAHKAKLPDEDAWAVLFRRLKSMGLNRLPNLVTGISDRHAYRGIKRVYRDYMTFRLNRRLLDSSLMDVPARQRATYENIFNEILSAPTNYLADFRVANFILHYGRENPNVVAAVFGSNQSPRPLGTFRGYRQALPENVVSQEKFRTKELDNFVSFS
ncbi:MAG: transposase [Deltaproteobacteria bacterium]|nr:transposase [Deltaproteobacteria bacterium]